jgi:hypothetical protein
MKIYSTIALVISISMLFSCAYKTIPIKGTYTDGNFEAYSEKNQEEVWSNLIDFFARKGLSIKIIDKSSGLLVSDKTPLIWTFENKKGLLNKSNAHVVLAQTIDPGPKKPLIPYGVFAEWNVRLKTVSGKTLVNINLVNPSYYLSPTNPIYTSFKSNDIKSTGNFERIIFDAIR